MSLNIFILYNSLSLSRDFLNFVIYLTSPVLSLPISRLLFNLCSDGIFFCCYCFDRFFHLQNFHFFHVCFLFVISVLMNSITSHIFLKILNIFSFMLSCHLYFLECDHLLHLQTISHDISFPCVLRFVSFCEFITFSGTYLLQD